LLQDLDQDAFSDDFFHTAEDRFYAVRPPEPLPLQIADDENNPFFERRNSASDSFLPDRKLDRIGSANWKTDKYDDHSYINRLPNYDQKEINVDYNRKWDHRNIEATRKNINRGGSESRVDYWNEPSEAVYNPYDVKYDWQLRNDYSPYASNRYDLPNLDRSDTYTTLADRLDEVKPGGSVPGYTSLLTASLGVKEQPAPEKKGQAV
jgi:hypothetical protein